jgi:hypothetical protein
MSTEHDLSRRNQVLLLAVIVRKGLKQRDHICCQGWYVVAFQRILLGVESGRER